MALSKTFADGEILTPADVNVHLVNHVPNPGDAFDTGWVAFSTGTVAVSGRRVGRTVSIRAIVNVTGLSDNIVQLNGGAAIVPAGFRPEGEMWGSGEALQPGHSYHVAILKVYATGGMTFIKPSVATDYLYGSVTYVI